MAHTLKNAVAAAILTALLTTPILGLQLHFEGYRLVLHAHWTPVLIAVALVFLFQLAKPWLARSSVGLKTRVRWPTLPRIQPAQQRTIVLLLLVIGVLWPFFGSRGAVDVATLALIYIVLGLGLNIPTQRR